MRETADEYATFYFQILTLLFLTIMLGTYVLAYKMVSVWGWVISGGIFIFPINYAITDITTEIYGYEYTKKLIKLAFICCLFFALVVPMIAILPSPNGWLYQPGYTHVLGNVFRFFVANTLGIICGITINSYLVAKWKVIMQGRHFWLRSIGSSAVGEFITSIIADIIAFAGTTDTMGIMKLMVGIFSVKLMYSVILALPSNLVVTHLKLKIGNRHSKTEFNSNPFSNFTENEKAQNALII